MFCLCDSEILGKDCVRALALFFFARAEIEEPFSVFVIDHVLHRMLALKPLV